MKRIIWGTAITAAAMLSIAAFRGISANDPAAETAARVQRGQYLVASIGCEDCHTPKKMGLNGPEPDLSRMLSGHPEGTRLPAPPAGQRSLDCDSHLGSDRVVGTVGRQLRDEHHAGPKHRHRHLDRGHVRVGSQDRPAHGRVAAYPAADAMAGVPESHRRRLESHLLVSAERRAGP